LSKFGLFAFIFACLAPWAGVMRDQAGGKWLPADPTISMPVLMAFEILGTALFVLAILMGAVAAVQVALRWSELRGIALALGGLVLAAAGMLGSNIGGSFQGFSGGAGTYDWRLTLVVGVAAIICEIVLALVRPRQAEAA
jgi:hypothetical protein